MTQDIKERIANYWNKRAKDFKNQSIVEMQNNRYEEWMEIITSQLPKDKLLKVLDIGTGAGYMAMLLASKGHSVTGVDLCAEMIAAAKEASSALDLQIEFFQQDAEKLQFPVESFDLIITRNLTWTLPNLDKDYALWYSFLKPGGLLMNFDADYGQTTFNKEAFLKFKEKVAMNATAPQGKSLHGDLSVETLQECDDIKHSLEVSKHRRPGWDVNLLKAAGFSEVQVKFTLNHNHPHGRGGMFGIFAYK